MKWRRVSGVAGPTYFSEDGQWAILIVKSGEHRLCREQQPVGEFPTLRLAQKAAAQQATDYFEPSRKKTGEFSPDNLPHGRVQ